MHSQQKKSSRLLYDKGHPLDRSLGCHSAYSGVSFTQFVIESSHGPSDGFMGMSEVGGDSDFISGICENISWTSKLYYYVCHASFLVKALHGSHDSAYSGLLIGLGISR